MQYPKFSMVKTTTLACVFVFASLSSAQMTVDIGGRIQVDAAFYDEDVSELGSGTEFRRVRLFAAGNIDDNWKYKIQFDFSGGEVETKDAFVSYSGLNLGTLKIGHFKTPFSLEEQDSSKYITFMERASINSFVPGRRIGVGLTKSFGNNTYAASVFGNTAADTGEDEGLGFAARFTAAPRVSTHGFVHLGVAVSLEEPTTTDDGSDTIRFRSRPESHVTSQRLVNGGTITGVNNIAKLGLEAAYSRGPLSVQGEYISTSVDADAGDVDYDGYYIYASYFPWGGTRPYKNGVFGRVKAENTWEFAIRYSNIDLSDNGGGEQDNITLGANYYINPYLRVMANYVIADVDGGINGDEEPSVFQMRVSMDFK